MSSTILFIILIGVFLAVLPVWPYSRAWGPFPAVLVAAIVGLMVVLMFLKMI